MARKLPQNLSGQMTLKESEVSQKINLRNELGFDPEKNPELAQQAGQLLIDEIVDRTLSSKDIHGERFDSYDPTYKESDAYQAFGKTSKVNMQLTGNMLGQMTVKSVDSEGVEIGWTDTTENAKAYNHMEGDTVTQRQFFGVTDKEVQKVKRRLKSSIDNAKRIDEVSNTKTAFDLINVAERARRLSSRDIEFTAAQAFLDALDSDRGLF